MMYVPQEPLPKIAVIFKGTDRILKKEVHQYHPAVHVFFNRAAWATRPYQMEYLSMIWKPHVLANQDRWCELDGRSDTLLFQELATYSKI